MANEFVGRLVESSGSGLLALSQSLVGASSRRMAFFGTKCDSLPRKMTRILFLGVRLTPRPLSTPSPRHSCILGSRTRELLTNPKVKDSTWAMTSSIPHGIKDGDLLASNSVLHARFLASVPTDGQLESRSRVRVFGLRVKCRKMSACRNRLQQSRVRVCLSLIGCKRPDRPRG